jgi:hypothetical protein
VEHPRDKTRKSVVLRQRSSKLTSRGTIEFLLVYVPLRFTVSTYFMHFRLTGTSDDLQAFKVSDSKSLVRLGVSE